ncbi:MAG: hypothetical protein KIT87_04710 [Anaerolineae bacterium]|nr:hypothetical protein [Anaerolineae bacterium]
MLLGRILNFVATWSWAIVIVVFLVYFLFTVRALGFGRAVRNVFSLGTPLVILMIALVVVTLLNAIIFVEPTEIGVTISLPSAGGIRERPLRSGLHLKLPFLEEVVRYPISTQNFTLATVEDNTAGSAENGAVVARTSDGQEVTIESTTIFRIDPDQVIRLHIDWQNRYIEDFVRPVLRGIIRSQASQYKADEINSSRRLDLERDMDVQVRELFRQRGLEVDRFILRSIMFTPEYAASIEAKQVALQAIIQRENEAEQKRRAAQGDADAATINAEGNAAVIRTIAQADADAVRLRGQAEADALRKIGEVVKSDPNLITYHYIDKLGPDIRVMLVPNNVPYLLPLPSLDGTSTITGTGSLNATPQPTSNPLTPTPLGTPTPMAGAGLPTLFLTSAASPTPTATPAR